MRELRDELYKLKLSKALTKNVEKIQKIDVEIKEVRLKLARAFREKILNENEVKNSEEHKRR